MSALTLASAPVPRVVSGRHAASTGRRATRPDAPYPAPGSRALGSRRRRNAWRIVVAAVDPDDVERPGSDRDDYADWKAAKDDTSEAFKRAAAQAGRKEDFVVGATPLDEKMLSRVMLQLLNNHARGIPAAPFLDKIKDDMCLDGYKSVLVGIGRTRQWALAREIVDWVRRQGLEQGKTGAQVLTSNWFVALIRRRVDDAEWEAAVEVFEYMRDFDGVPSGECIEMFAQVTDHESRMNAMTVERCRRVGEWLAGSDAGKALWHLSFGAPGMATPEAAPARSVRIAMPTEEFDIDGDIDKLREQFKDYLE